MAEPARNRNRLSVGEYHVVGMVGTQAYGVVRLGASHYFGGLLDDNGEPIRGTNRYTDLSGRVFSVKADAEDRAIRIFQAAKEAAHNAD